MKTIKILEVGFKKMFWENLEKNIREAFLRKIIKSGIIRDQNVLESLKSFLKNENPRE